MKGAMLAVVLSVVTSVFGLGLGASPASADILGYPWSDATTLNASTYDWGYATCPSSDPNCKSMTYIMNGVTYGEADPWGYYLRNCTSYVAEKLTSLGVPASKVTGLGNGGEWYDKAPNNGLSRGTTPQVGAAAVSTSVGHVAYVEAVNSDGSITVSEYNYAIRGGGGTRTGTPANLGFDKFVYFASLMSSSPGAKNLTIGQALSITASGGFYVSAPIKENFSVTNTSGGTLTVKSLILAVRDPSGANYDQACTSQLVLATGSSYACSLSQTWGSPGTYTLWPDWQDTNGSWHTGDLGASQQFTLAWAGTLEATSPLAISAPGGYYVGVPITEKFTVTNTTGNNVAVQSLILAVRDPAGNNYDQSCASGMTIGPWLGYTCTLTRSWGSAGTYTMWADWEDSNGAWHQGQLGPNQTFNLSWAGTLEATSPLAISAPSGWHPNVTLNETFTVTNTTGNNVAVQALILAVRDPYGINYDQPCVPAGTLTLGPWLGYTCTLTQSWGSSGTYTVWADWEDSNGAWHQGQLGPNQTFSLS